ncbi:DUF4043 family protein, partial [Salmonella enterica]|nr:DUF4043 family protein [Salmonella enterica]HBL9925211.1 DUF4043 family protein [Salmonella enterica subsp. enterica serovar Overschie]EIH1699945.1 DUF4043 family protein [Salmonella enterica]EIS9097250.1 DUF4043 family protein [Salmonella enterica]EIW3134702.1 DUF4043 family protein [Salmonella enterica]
LRIDQRRHQVDAGGRMSQQRTKFDLVKSSSTLLGTYFNDLQDQCAVVHLAGARGDFYADDIIVPLADHPEFMKIMINDVIPPTHDRHFFGGDATSFETLDFSDVFTLSFVDNMALFIDEMAHPLQPVRMKGDELYGEDPYYVMYVTPCQWNDWYLLASLNRAGAGEDEDGVNWHDKVPDYVKDHNLVIMKSLFGGKPGKYWSIPLPYGYNMFFLLGNTAEGVTRGNLSTSKAAGNIVGGLLEVDGAYNIASGATKASSRWGGKSLYRDLVDRTKAALDTNPKNVLLAAG